MAGLIMPRHRSMIAAVAERIESVSLPLLLPLFFALIGQRTRIDLMTGKSKWGYGAAILAIAVIVWQIRRSFPHREGPGDRLEGFDWSGSSDEYARTGGIGDPESWAGSGYSFAGVVHPAGPDGAGHYLHDHAAPDRYENPARAAGRRFIELLSMTCGQSRLFEMVKSIGNARGKSGRAIGFSATRRLQYLFDLPEMAALMGGQHAKGAEHVVTEAGIDGRLNTHFIEGKTSAGFYGCRK